MGGNTALTGGYVTNDEQPRASANNSTTQSISNSTWTAVTFDTEDYDVGSMHSTSVNTSKFTVPTGGGGIYLLTAQVTFAANATGVRQIRFLKGSGATDIGGTSARSSVTATDIETLSSSLVVSLAAGDIVEVYAYQTSGGSLNIGSATAFAKNRMTVTKLW
jgi:hypothetical protein